MMADDKDGPFGKTAAGELAADPGAGENIATPSLAAAQDGPEGTEAPVASPAPGPQKPEKLKKPSSAPGLVAALIVGAIGGFGGAYGLRYLNSLQGPDPVDHIAELNTRADALEHNGAASAAALAALENRLASDEGAAGKARAAAEAALSDLRKAVAARPVAAADGVPAEAPDLGPIEDKIGALEKKLGSLDAVQQKLGQIEASLAGAESGRQGRSGSRARRSARQGAFRGPFARRRRDEPDATRQPRRALRQ